MIDPRSDRFFDVLWSVTLRIFVPGFRSTRSTEPRRMNRPSIVTGSRRLFGSRTGRSGRPKANTDNNGANPAIAASSMAQTGRTDEIHINPTHIHRTTL